MSLPRDALHEGAARAGSHEDWSVDLTPQDAEKILKLVCRGAEAEEAIHLHCYVIDPGGSVRRLESGQPGSHRNEFCECAWRCHTASRVCDRWYAATAKAYADAGGPLSPQVLECPFGLMVVVAPVVHRDLVRMVLFTGNWRYSGSEGVIYRRIARASITPEERTLLRTRVLQANALVSEDLELHKNRFQSVVEDVSRLIGLIYAEHFAVREHRLARLVLQGIEALPRSTLAEACAACDDLFARVCEDLDLRCILLFANMGLQDRLAVCSSAGLNKTRATRLFLHGVPRELTDKIAAWDAMSPAEKESWTRAHLRSDEPRLLPLDFATFSAMLPLELGSSFCGILAVGPRKHAAIEHEHTITDDDLGRLIRMGHGYLRNGLADVADRQEIAEILARTGHILRGPLLAIQGEIEAMKEFLAAGRLDEAAFREICDNLQEQVDDIAAQAELMEEAKRTSLGQRGTPWFQRAPIVALVNKVWQGLAAKARARSITVEGFPSLRALPDVAFDWNQMRVVFANLLHNACKYAHGNTVIHLSGEKIDVRGNPAVRIGIANFGVGIHPAEIKRAIWQPGFPGSIRDLKRDVEGTGMGLAVCRDIVENVHHGRIYATCEENRPPFNSYQHCLVKSFVELPIEQPPA